MAPRCSRVAVVPSACSHFFDAAVPLPRHQRFAAAVPSQRRCRAASAVPPPFAAALARRSAPVPLPCLRAMVVGLCRWLHEEWLYQ